MLDIIPPSFSGSDHEKIEQMEKYLMELYESINRKTSNLSYSDFNQLEKNKLIYLTKGLNYYHGYDE
jgi:hypothetical protein